MLDDRASKLYAELLEEQKAAAKRLCVSLVTLARAGRTRAPGSRCRPT